MKRTNAVQSNPRWYANGDTPRQEGRHFGEAVECDYYSRGILSHRTTGIGSSNGIVLRWRVLMNYLSSQKAQELRGTKRK